MPAISVCPPSADSRHRTEEGLNVPPTWSLALSYRQDFTVSYFTDTFWQNILLQQQLNTQGLADHLEWNIYRGPHLCVMFNPIPKMRNCKYSKYTKISNAIKYKRSLYTTYLHGMGVARRERLVRYLFNVLLFIQNLFRIVNANATKRTRRKYFQPSTMPRPTLIDQRHKIFRWALIVAKVCKCRDAIISLKEGAKKHQMSWAELEKLR